MKILERGKALIHAPAEQAAPRPVIIHCYEGNAAVGKKALCGRTCDKIHEVPSRAAFDAADKCVVCMSLSPVYPVPLRVVYR